MEKFFRCSECKGDSIQFQVWAEEGGKIIEGGTDHNEVWCEDCQTHTSSEVKPKVLPPDIKTIADFNKKVIKRFMKGNHE